MLAYTAVENGLFSALTILFFVGAHFTARNLRRSLRSGVVSYGGNSPRAATTKSYPRSETPGMYWYGICLGVIMTAIWVVMGCAFIVLMLSD